MSDWSQYIDQVATQVVRIEMQSMWGTGFVHYATDGGVRCIVLARHVLEQPHRQDQRFRIWHGNRVSEFGGRGSKDALLVRLTDDYRDIDTAVVAVIAHQLPKPAVPLIGETEREGITAGMAARARGRKGGRPRVMTPEKLRYAQNLMSDRTRSIPDICRELGDLPTSTLYHYLHADGALKDPGRRLLAP